jgi:hypothetical protein
LPHCGWQKFCRFILSFSGKTSMLQQKKFSPGLCSAKQTVAAVPTLCCKAGLAFCQVTAKGIIDAVKVRLSTSNDLKGMENHMPEMYL